MTSSSDSAFPAPGRRHEKKKSTKRTVTTERFQAIDSPEGKKVRRLVSRKTVSHEVSLVESWDEIPRVEGADDLLRGLEGSGGEAIGYFPLQWKLSLRGVRRSDGTAAPEVEGDYILDRIDRDRRRARWEHDFPAQHGLYRAGLEIRPAAGGGWEYRAELTGSRPGPSWRGVFAPSPLRVTLTRHDSQLALAGLHWPSRVELTPLGWEGSVELARDSWASPWGEEAAGSGDFP